MTLPPHKLASDAGDAKRDDDAVRDINSNTIGETLLAVGGCYDILRQPDCGWRIVLRRNTR